MGNRSFTLSLIVAGIAAFMVWSYLDGKEKEYVKAYGKSVPVVKAKADIGELEIIDDRKVHVVNVPKKFLAPGHFSSVEELYNTIAAVPILQGEQITKPRVTFPGDRTGLSRQISVGKRAFSIPVREASSVSKLIKPGDRVDLITTVDYAGGRKDKISVKTILQDVLVLSTGFSITNSVPVANVRNKRNVRQIKLNEYTNFNTVAFELSPFEIQKLIFILSTGTGIYLSLRNNNDKQVEKIGGTGLYDVLGDDASGAKEFFLKSGRRVSGKR